jgi:ankyrin repeat protein
MLLAAGADIDESDSTGRVALDWAREMRHRDIAALLEAAGRD